MKSRLVNGLRVFSPATREELIESALGNNAILVAVNAEKILSATPESRDILAKGMGYPDGVGAVWALRRKGLPESIKVPGCELWLDIIKKYYLDKRFYLIGGTEDVIVKTVAKLRSEFPGINVVGSRNGYFKTQYDTDALITDVVQKKPDVIFVAMGSPRQEFLMESLHRHHAALYQGLGGSFDVFTGGASRAPRYLVRMNLEWLYRLFREPSRIGRQLRLVKFLILLAAGRY